MLGNHVPSVSRNIFTLPRAAPDGHSCGRACRWVRSAACPLWSAVVVKRFSRAQHHLDKIPTCVEGQSWTAC
eukprot:5534445-Prymnesium_polylepis.1